MTLTEYIDQVCQDAYNEGWNKAASEWDLATAKLLSEGCTAYTGEKREAFLQGWRDCQDEMILNQKTP